MALLAVRGAERFAYRLDHLVSGDSATIRFLHGVFELTRDNDCHNRSASEQGSRSLIPVTGGRLSLFMSACLDKGGCVLANDDAGKYKCSFIRAKNVGSLLPLGGS